MLKKTFGSPFLAFFAGVYFFVVNFPVTFDSLVSPVPGWHVTLHPPYYLWISLVRDLLLLSIVAYWVFSKPARRSDRILFYIHASFALSIAIYWRNPHTSPGLEQIIQPISKRQVELNNYFDITSWILFAVAVVLFFIYFIRISRFRNRIPE